MREGGHIRPSRHLGTSIDVAYTLAILLFSIYNLNEVPEIAPVLNHCCQLAMLYMISMDFLTTHLGERSILPAQLLLAVR
jgi:hypothetical protein